MPHRHVRPTILSTNLQTEAEAEAEVHECEEHDCRNTILQNVCDNLRKHIPTVERVVEQVHITSRFHNIVPFLSIILAYYKIKVKYIMDNKKQP